MQSSSTLVIVVGIILTLLFFAVWPFRLLEQLALFNTERFSKVLDLDTQLNLYRIVQELLSNAVKHSRANEVLIMLVCIKEKVVLHYEDDGIGVDPDKLYQNSASMGLSGIRERVRALSGSLDIQTAEGKGFRVAIEMGL